MPIFAGLKNAACTASAKNPPNASGMLWAITAAQIHSSTSNCSAAEPIITSRLENRSLNHPAIGANNT